METRPAVVRHADAHLPVGGAVQYREVPGEGVRARMEQLGEPAQHGAGGRRRVLRPGLRRHLPGARDERRRLGRRLRLHARQSAAHRGRLLHDPGVQNAGAENGDGEAPRGRRGTCRTAGAHAARGADEGSAARRLV